MTKTKTASALVLVLLLVGCGGGGDDGGGDPGAITSITSPLVGGIRNVFVLHGQGFAAAGATAQALFQANTGTPFGGLSSSTAAVDVRILSDATAMGVSPIAHGDAFQGSVELTLSNGTTIFGPGSLVSFLAPVYNIVGPNDDSIQGGPLNDTIFGGIGNDTLRGGPGDDNLFGEADDDFLDGEDGHDVVDGGPGEDTFAIEPVPGTYDDVVADFSRSADDLILMGVPGTLLTFDLIASVTDSGGGGNVTITWDAGGTLVLWNLGTGAIDSLDTLVDSGVRILIAP